MVWQLAEKRRRWEKIKLGIVWESERETDRELVVLLVHLYTKDDYCGRDTSTGSLCTLLHAYIYGRRSWYYFRRHVKSARRERLLRSKDKTEAALAAGEVNIVKRGVQKSELNTRCCVRRRQCPERMCAKACTSTAHVNTFERKLV